MSKKKGRNRYGKNYSDDSFWNKVKKVCKKAGIKTIYSALTLYYTYKKKDTPTWAKGVIIGALGYFISPLDAIPDITPGVGYTDDIGVLLAAVATVGAYIDNEVKRYAKDKLRDWFGNFDEKELL